MGKTGRSKTIGKIVLGEIGVSVDTAMVSCGEELRERYRDFGGKKSARMEIACRPTRRKLSEPPPVRFLRDDAKQCLNYLAGRHSYGTLDLERKRGELLLPDGPAPIWGYLQAHFLMGVYAELLLPRGGFLLHAASVDCGGQGALFAADSGGGKTTIAGMRGWPQVFSDDVTLVFKKGKDYWVEGTPWGKPGRRGVPRKISACYFLKKARKFALRRVTPAVAATNLLRLSGRLADSDEFDRLLLKAAADFALAIPAFEMSFARGSALPRLLGEALS